jgi:uncharacterized protein
MKFLCDQMLSRIGKWLRAAGHDTDIVIEAIPDKEVLNLTLTNSRFLVTRDRHFLKMKAAKPFLIYLKNNDFKSCIQELNRKIHIDWLYAPFSRCLNCNSLFTKPSLEDLIEQVPARIRAQKKKFWYCPHCQRIYWEGTHTANMLRQLTLLQNEAKNISSMDLK